VSVQSNASENSLQRGVAFIGTGIMGAPMALRLLRAGLLRAYWNRRANRASVLSGEGLTMASSPAAAADGAQLICFCLTDGPAVHDVMFGPDGCINGCAIGAPPLIVDFSTSSPLETRRLADEYRTRAGGSWLDAPVSGGAARAAKGDLIVFCGGESRDFEAAQPVLRVVSSRASLVGELGAGQTIKLCAQLIAAPTIVAIAEAIAAAAANGIDARKIPEFLTGGLADSPLLQLFGRRMAEGQVEPRLGALATMLKDIDLAVEMARSAGSPTPLGAVAAQMYRVLVNQGRGADELNALVELFDGRAYGHLRSP
jgi:3-hydroxyisobutyrate dehydrogenase-like beta-hydroxyacid dehydrogenase